MSEWGELKLVHLPGSIRLFSSVQRQDTFAKMLRFLMLGVAVMALASPGNAIPAFNRRFMDSVMGSNCGPFGCKRDSDDEVSRAVRDMADSLFSAKETMDRDLGDVESNLIEQVREQSDNAERALEEREEDPIQKMVRSLMEYAEEEDMKRMAEEDPIQKTVRSIMEAAEDEDMKRMIEEDPIQKTVRSIMEAAEEEDMKRMAEEDPIQKTVRSIMDLAEDEEMKRMIEEDPIQKTVRSIMEAAEEEDMKRMIEEDPIQKTVRSIMDMAEEEDMKRMAEEDPIQKTVRSIMDMAEEEDMKRMIEEDPIQKTVRSVMDMAEEEDMKRMMEEEEELEQRALEEEMEERAWEEEEMEERALEEEAAEEMKRSLLDLHDEINDLKKRDAEEMEEMQVRAPLEFARRALDENFRMARAINDLYEALEEKR